MRDKYKVVEIFHSIEGEGKRSGYPCTFIRLHGCNLRCSYCDTMYANEGEDFTEMTLGEILAEMENAHPNKMVTVTGGEPLMAKGIESLLLALAEIGFEVNVETNGSVALPERPHPNVFWTMDMKTPSSGMNKLMNENNLRKLDKRDVVKFVVGSKKDLDWAYCKIRMHDIEQKANIFLSPVWGEIEPADIAGYIKENKLDARVQMQLHKLLYPVDMRGV